MMKITNHHRSVLLILMSFPMGWAFVLIDVLAPEYTEYKPVLLIASIICLGIGIHYKHKK